MTDIERDLRDMMQRRVAQLGRPPAPTGGLVRRARRRRAGSAALATASVLAIVVGGVAASRSLVVDQSVPPVSNEYENGKLVVTGSNYDLFAADPERLDIAEFRSSDRYFADYAWSPDGSRLAVVLGYPGGRFTGSEMSVYILDADGAVLRRVMPCPGHGDCDVQIGSGVSWSPDGVHIAVSGEGAVYVADVDTGAVRQVTGDAASGAFDPAWSPDGTGIAFVRGPDSRPAVSADAAGVYVVSADGTGLARVAARHAFDPAWSPDGTRILFSSRDDVYIVGADGGGLERIVSGQAAAWSPDGSQIAYLATPAAGQGRLAEVWTMSADGQDNLRLYRSDCCVGDLAGPTWSPDGGAIAFSVTLDNEADSGTYVINADGTGLRRLAAYIGVGAPAWQPTP